jgi:hypothetical protein
MSSTTLWSRKFLSFLLLLVLLTGAGLGLLAKEVVHSHLSQLATSLNEDTARVLRNTLWADFSGMLKVDDTGSRAASMAMEDFLSLREKLAKTMTGSEIVKVKVYNRQGVCVFSTDPRQIGELKASNPGVVAALAGEVSSGLTHRGEFDAMHAQLAHVDIFHSYVPIKDGQDIVGVFEVYQNVSRVKGWPIASSGKSWWSWPQCWRCCSCCSTWRCAGWGGGCRPMRKRWARATRSWPARWTMPAAPTA